MEDFFFGILTAGIIFSTGYTVMRSYKLFGFKGWTRDMTTQTDVRGTQTSDSDSDDYTSTDSNPTQTRAPIEISTSQEEMQQIAKQTAQLAQQHYDLKQVLSHTRDLLGESIFVNREYFRVTDEALRSKSIEDTLAFVRANNYFMNFLANHPDIRREGDVEMLKKSGREDIVYSAFETYLFVDIYTRSIITMVFLIILVCLSSYTRLYFKLWFLYCLKAKK